MNKLLAVPLILAALLSFACSEDDDGSGAPAPTSTSAAASPTSSPGPMPGATATAFPPVDGTVDPLGFGGTEPVTFKGTQDPPQGIATLRDVRIGAHPEQGGWDRIVFEFAGDLPPGSVAYVESMQQCGSGEPVQVQGQAILAIRFTDAQAHNDAGQSTVRSLQLQGPGGAIVAARSVCDFEGHVEWAVGTDARERFKVVRLTSPNRLVVDIKW